MSFLSSLLPVLIPALVPAAVAQIKVFVPKIPKVVYPILAAGLGVGSTLLTGVDWGAGALAGLAGVGVREVVDQTKKLFEQS